MRNVLLKTSYSLPYIIVVADILMFLSLIFRWDDMVFLQRCCYFFVIFLTVHQLEESRFPGGFVYMYNMSRDPEHVNPRAYPMNRLCCWLVDTLGLVIFCICTLFFWRPMLSLLCAYFGIWELVTHTMTGVRLLKKYHDRGKETIYMPGSASCWFLFIPLSITIIIYMVMNHTFGAGMWLLTAVAIAAYFVVCCILPENLMKNPESKYPYVKLEPGYFSKYLDEDEKKIIGLK